jgi:hypothetical protein
MTMADAMDENVVVGMAATMGRSFLGVADFLFADEPTNNSTSCLLLFFSVSSSSGGNDDPMITFPGGLSEAASEEISGEVISVAFSIRCRPGGNGCW